MILSFPVNYKLLLNFVPLAIGQSANINVVCLAVNGVSYFVFRNDIHHNVLVEVNCSAPPPVAQYQTTTLDDGDCTYEGCNVTYRCNDGLTLADGQTASYSLPCVRRTNMLAEWEGNAQTCCKKVSWFIKLSIRWSLLHNPSNFPPRCIVAIYCGP